MNQMVSTVAKILAILTVLTDFAIILYIVSAIVSVFNSKIRQLRNTVIMLIRPNARILAFIIALTSMSGSLFYSEVAKYSPCLLCWWQRIFMYPQTVLLAMGIIKNDKNTADYSIALSSIGGVIALYHYYIQLGGKTFFSCAQVGYSSACSERFSLEFGYVSIPMMALTAFAAILILMSISKQKTS